MGGGKGIDLKEEERRDIKNKSGQAHASLTFPRTEVLYSCKGEKHFKISKAASERRCEVLDVFLLIFMACLFL